LKTYEDHHLKNLHMKVGTAKLRSDTDSKEQGALQVGVPLVFLHHQIASLEPCRGESAMKFHVAAVQRPSASAVKVVQAGNRVVMSSASVAVERAGESVQQREDQEGH
jgi:hypothetical protein